MKPCLGLTLATALLLSSCGKTSTVVVGTKRGVEGEVLGEIVAQLLENRWEGNVKRRIGFGDTAILHQAMLGGDVTLYPEYTGTILSETLNEVPSSDPGVAFERARGEMKRTARFDLLDPLGYDNRTVLVVPASVAADLKTITDAAARKEGWKIGVSSEFELSKRGIPLLSSYDLPQSAPVRGMAAEQLFPGLMDGSLTLIGVPASDGRLLSNEWKALEDDKAVFPPQQVALLVREDALIEDPTLKPVLQQLAGRISLATIRELTKKVIVDEVPPPEVAGEFLQREGLAK